MNKIVFIIAGIVLVVFGGMYSLRIGSKSPNTSLLRATPTTGPATGETSTIMGANQEKGNAVMGRKVQKDPKIPMDNMVVYQEDGAINVLYLILGPEKFLSMRPSSKAAISNDRFISLAANIGDAIKEYK